MPRASRNRGYGSRTTSSDVSRSREKSNYDPKEEGFDSDQAEEIRAWNDYEAAERRFLEEFAD